MSDRFFKWITRAAILLGLFALGWFGFAYFSLPVKPPSTAGTPTKLLEWPVPDLPTPEEWKVFLALTGAPPTSGPLAERLRLAGTFFVYGAATDDPESGRSAILDDLQKQSQLLVSEGDKVGDILIERIHQDRVLVSQNGHQEELWLSYAEGPGQPSRKPSTPTKEAANPETVLETNRFGKRVGESRWVFKEEALRAYYEEIMQDPERLASLFLSMKPDYQEDNLAGYALDMEGEQAFFGAIGLQNGDVIRRVNSMSMVSQNRAEYFIREFIKGRLGAVVLDIERGGEEEKMIYLLR